MKKKKTSDWVVLTYKVCNRKSTYTIVTMLTIVILSTYYCYDY